MSAPVIRRAGAEDAAALALVGAATFLETFADLIDVTDMVAHVRNKHAEQLYRAFASDPASALWITELPDTASPVGYAVLTTPDLPIAVNPGDIELRRIYILSKWHGGGLGRRLIEATIEQARAMDKRRLLIGVYEGNDKAIGFYKRMGAEQIGTRSFQVGDALFDDLIFGLDL